MTRQRLGRPGWLNWIRSHPLPVILIAFVLLSLMHNAATPIYEAPDEIWHDAYIRWLVRTGELPSATNDESGAYQQAAQPPLYYATASLIRKHLSDDDLEALRWHNPGFGTQAPLTTPDNKNMLIHTDREAWPWQGATLAIHATRLTSLVFGLLTVIGVWHLAREAFHNRRAAATAASLVAFHPHFVFMSSVISNDPAAAAWSTLGLWLTARTIRRDTTWHRSLAMGLIAGCAALSKTSTLPLIGLMLAGGLLGDLRHPRDRGKKLTPVTVINLGVMVGTALAVAGWWFLRNAHLYGDPLGLGSHRNTPWGRAELASLADLIPELPLLLRSFWSSYGWGHVAWPAWLIWALWGSTLILGLQAGVRWFRETQRVLSPGNRQDCTGIDRWWILTLALAWGGGITAALIRWMQMVEAPHGRLLFPAIGAWALWLTAGIRSTGSLTRRLARSERVLTLGLLAVLTGLAPGARILATYAPPRLQPVEGLEAACRRPLLTYGDSAQLHCIKVSPPRVAVGEDVEVEACWSTRVPLIQDYTIFVHLIDSDMNRLGERHTYPGLGRLPTSRWPVNQAFCETYRLTVEPWADAPRQYKVEVGLFEAETGERLPAETAGGNPADPPVVDSVTVIPKKEIKPDPKAARSVTIGNFAALTGFDAPDYAKPGETIRVTLYWEAIQTHPSDAVAFVHLWVPGSEAPLAQHDARPRQGEYPTPLWVEGDVVPDRHTLKLPGDLAPGSYPLWAGLYLHSNSTRLTAVGPDGQLPHDLVSLGTIEVK